MRVRQRAAQDRVPAARFRGLSDPSGISHSALSDHRRRHALEGRWIGDDYTLTIDEDAVQANRNPTRPFEWDALHILNTTENMIVFELGGDRFVGLLEGERMTLSQIGRPGYHVLTRQR